MAEEVSILLLTVTFSCFELRTMQVAQAIRVYGTVKGAMYTVYVKGDTHFGDVRTLAHVRSKYVCHCPFLRPSPSTTHQPRLVLPAIW